MVKLALLPLLSLSLTSLVRLTPLVVPVIRGIVYGCCVTKYLLQATRGYECHCLKLFTNVHSDRVMIVSHTLFAIHVHMYFRMLFICLYFLAICISQLKCACTRAVYIISTIGRCGSVFGTLNGYTGTLHART